MLPPVAAATAALVPRQDRAASARRILLGEQTRTARADRKTGIPGFRAGALWPARGTASALRARRGCAPRPAPAPRFRPPGSATPPRGNQRPALGRAAPEPATATVRAPLPTCSA